MEAFLLPRDACGTVVQLAAQAGGGPDLPARFEEARRDGPIATPRWWPALPDPAPDPAVLERVVLGVPTLDEARALFGGLLDGVEQPAGAHAVELAWPGGGRLRLEAGHDRAGIDRLELAGNAPERILAGTRVVGS